MLLKYPRKMLWVLKTKFIGNFTHRLIRVEDLCFRSIDQFQVNILVDRFTSLLLNEITKIISRKV